MAFRSDFNSFFKYLLCLIVLIVSCKQNNIPEPQDLSVSEGFITPIGFYDATPTFSWKLPVSDNIKSQSAYQIVVASAPDLLPDAPDLWDSEKQINSQSTYVKFDGEALKSRQKVYWAVKYWDQEGRESGWSEVNTLEMGLLNNADWKGSWIGLDTGKDSIKGTKDVVIHKPQYLRKSFELSNEPSSARLHITAKGVFDVHLNGENVSDDVMPPGWTPYEKRIETLTYDVSNLLESGQNTIAVELASGWYAGRLGWSKTKFGTVESPRVLVQLEIQLSDGSMQFITSDESWKATTDGPIRFAEIYDGELYDANYEISNWTTSDFDDSGWIDVMAEPLSQSIKLEPKRHHTVKTKLTIQSKDIIKKDETVIFNLDQNIVGVAKVKVPMKKGDTLRIRFSEMLQPDGSFYTDNYRSAKSTDYYVAAADGIIEWYPKFTFHGFQFVELMGYDTSVEPATDWVSGLVQYSDFDKQGTFKSSHEKLNKLQSNIVWGLRGNFFDIPTDCPQRDERLGWTGDAQVFAPTSMFNADVFAFWASWLQSLRESQYENGGIPFVVPDVLRNNRVSSGWGDACVIIPWEMYFRTGDTSILAENFDMMKAWVRYHESQTENYISRMNTFGDWLQPFPIKENNNRGDTSRNLIGTAFFALSAKLIADSAEVLGKTDEQQFYNDLFSKVAQSFENEFFDSTGKIKGVESTQTSYLLALAFGLISEENIENAQHYLLEEIEEANTHLRTGFLGTPLLSRVLDDMGEIDLMYQILLNETYPSWFYSINQGATTIWERWNSYSKTEGFNPQRMNSLNHYSYGAIGQWMYERIAGIAPLAPGYKRIRIAPVPRSPLTWASASLNTPYGKVESSWEVDKDSFKLEVNIPPNTSAEIAIPVETSKAVFANGVPIQELEGLKLHGENGEFYKLTAQSGSYLFQTQLN